MHHIEFKKEHLDIANLLNSRAVVGTYRGRETWTEVEKIMDGAPDGGLILIDLRRANPLQYVFCQHAFGPLFEALKDQKWTRKYVMFQMHDFHTPGFFRGVLKYLGSEYSRKESEKGFVSSGMCTKLIIGDTESIKFVGNLNENETTILDVVDNLKQVTSEQVVKKTTLAAEIVVDGLRSLVDKYFVVEHGDQSGEVTHYYSFYNYFIKG